MTLRNEVLKMALDNYGTDPEYLFSDDPATAVLRHPSGKWYGIIMEVGRYKFDLEGDGTVDVINFKCDPILSGSLRLQKGIYPAYHMNKEKWISVLLDGVVDLLQIETLMDMSYDLVGAKKTRKRK